MRSWWNKPREMLGEHDKGVKNLSLFIALLDYNMYNFDNDTWRIAETITK